MKGVMMKRGLLLALFAALAAAPPALAKRTRIAVIPPAAPATTGSPWHARIVVTVDGRPYHGPFRPQLGLIGRDGWATKLFSSRATSRAGVYAVVVVFPHAGTWRYWIHDGIEGGGWYFTVRVSA
jgi:hypothetical protein